MSNQTRQCLTFQCQEQLPGLGHCVKFAEAARLRQILKDLVEHALPFNWADDDTGDRDMFTAAWRAALNEVGTIGARDCLAEALESVK